jgi:transketolase
MMDSARAFARDIRVQAVRMVHRARSSHVGGILSAADILAVLYHSVLRVDPRQPDWPERDRFVMSKGHAAAAVYAALALRGFFPLSQLETFYQNGSKLAGHVTAGVPGVEVSTGSLGHGLPIACGLALAGKRDGVATRVFSLLSDGECDEGSTWEAVLFASHHRLHNLVAIVDYNKSQGLGRVSDVLSVEPFADKWRAFGWAVEEIDGHDCSAIERALQPGPPSDAAAPACVIAHTIKGKGVSFMEDRLVWHYRPPSEEEMALAIQELTRT